MSRSRSLPSMPYLAGDRSRHHAWARTSVTATLLIVAGALSSTIVAATASASVASDHALASRINMHRTDLRLRRTVDELAEHAQPARMGRYVSQGDRLHPTRCWPSAGGEPRPLRARHRAFRGRDGRRDVTDVLRQGPEPAAECRLGGCDDRNRGAGHRRLPRAVDRSSALPCLKAAFQAIAVAEQVPAGTKLTLKLLTPPPIGPSRLRGGFASRSPAPPSATSSTKPSTPSAGPSWRSASPPPASHSPPVGHSRSAKASSLGPRPSSGT